MLKTHINCLLLAVIVFNLCAVIGCHRGYYRRQADADAQRLIRQKSTDPRWNTATGNIEIDPQSRMFDPFSADHPPIPPDDAASNQFMNCVDGKEGYPHWHANGDTNYIENPTWQSYLNANEKGQVVLTLDQAYQLALINSPDLQSQRETLYLSALDVSLERFGFDTQLFTGYNAFFTSRGRFRGSREVGPNPASSNTLQGQIGANGGGLNFQKLGVTGTNFAVGLANTILFNFSGNNTQSATSLIDFSIIQPLLRGAGRDRIMESLTQSERTLLANVRQLERFRRNFYLQIAVGRNLANQLNRGGVFLGTPATGSSNAGGYVGLLEQQQRIRNQELNVRQLEAVLELFREFFRRQRLDAASLKLFETNVYDQQRNLLVLRNAYNTSLDRFKLTLGLPPDLDIVIDDSYLDKFELISDQINERLISTGILREETGNALNEVDGLFDKLVIIDDIATGVFVWPDDLADRISNLTPYIERAEATLETVVTADRSQLEEDFRELDAKRGARLAYLKKLQNSIETGKIISPVDAGLLETSSVPTSESLRNILVDPDSPDSLLNRAAKVKQQLADVRAKIAQFKQTESNLTKTELYQYVLKEFQEKIPGQLSEINNLILELSLLQARTRSNSIEIIDVDLSSDQAIEIARCMRRDWMNARASHVDNWRNIEFVANQLESQIDLVFEGDIGNTGDNPFRLRYETGQLRAGFRFDAPIVRMAERNQYRAALIDYQQSRRQYYQYEDSVKRGLRETLRLIDQNKVLFELGRRQVENQIENVEVNRYDLEEPVAPGATSSRLGTNAARNLADAINRLNGAQNEFLGSWVEFEVLRRNLDFDLGTMQLDALGSWVDPGKIDSSIGINTAAILGIELDCQFCSGAAVGIDLNPYPTTSINDDMVEPNLMFERDATSPAATDDILPLEVDKVEEQLIPKVNQPDSGMNRPSVLSRESASVSPNTKFVPNLLFNSVVEQTGSQAPSRSEILLKPMSQKTRKLMPALSVIKPLEKSKPSWAASQVAPTATPAQPSTDKKSDQKNSAGNTNQFSELEKASVSDQTTSEAPILASKIAGQFPDRPAKQASGISGKTQDEPLVQSPESSVLNLWEVIKSEEHVFRPIPIMEPTDPKPAESTTTVQTMSSLFESNSSPNLNDQWQSQKSSLGGILNRFRTK